MLGDRIIIVIFSVLISRHHSSRQRTKNGKPPPRVATLSRYFRVTSRFQLRDPPLLLIQATTRCSLCPQLRDTQAPHTQVFSTKMRTLSSCSEVSWLPEGPVESSACREFSRSWTIQTTVSLKLMSSGKPSATSEFKSHLRNASNSSQSSIRTEMNRSPMMN